LLAFFCGGISPARLSLPFLGLGFLLSATLLTANESLLYRTEETARYVFRVYVRNEGKIQITRGGRIHQKESGGDSTAWTGSSRLPGNDPSDDSGIA
jgi:lipopolysaccharide export LptBFGC system permease protein LptF